MKLSAKDTSYFKKTKNFIVPRALEMLSLEYGLDGRWPNERYVMLDHSPKGDGVYQFIVLDTDSEETNPSGDTISEMKFVITNVNTDVTFSPKKINFIEG